MIEQKHWYARYEDSAYTIKGLQVLTGIDRTSLRMYLNGTRIPQEKNMAIMQRAMAEIGDTKRLPLHKSWGYASNEEIDMLFNGGLGPERSAVVKTVEARNATKGKYL